MSLRLTRGTTGWSLQPGGGAGQRQEHPSPPPQPEPAGMGLISPEEAVLPLSLVSIQIAFPAAAPSPAAAAGNTLPIGCTIGVHTFIVSPLWARNYNRHLKITLQTTA